MTDYSQKTNSADLVVYGKIFTSERRRVGDGTSGMDNLIVEAFAVKDGKYVYVGDKAGAEAYVEAGKTEVVDYTGKGLVRDSICIRRSISFSRPMMGSILPSRASSVKSRPY